MRGKRLGSYALRRFNAAARANSQRARGIRPPVPGDLDYVPDNQLWSEMELEFPHESVLCWLFNDKIHQDPRLPAIKLGIIGFDDAGEVQILRPGWRGLLERFQHLERAEISSGDSSPATSTNSQPALTPSPTGLPIAPTLLISDPAALRTQTSTSSPKRRRLGPALLTDGARGVGPNQEDCEEDVGCSRRRLPDIPRAVPAPLTRQPSFLGPVQYGVALQDRFGAKGLSGEECQDRFGQLLGESAWAISAIKRASAVPSRDLEVQVERLEDETSTLRVEVTRLEVEAKSRRISAQALARVSKELSRETDSLRRTYKGMEIRQNREYREGVVRRLLSSVRERLRAVLPECIARDVLP